MLDREDRVALERFIVDNDDLERLEALLDEFNIFEATGLIWQEVRHSDFLTFLLDPRQNHGLGDAFLKRFLKRALAGAGPGVISPIEIDAIDLHGAVVERERYYIDILIHDEAHRLVCAIENKVGACEGHNQLQTYHERVEREFPGWRAVFVFLTPDGHDPSDTAYISFSYAEVADLIGALCRTRQSTLGQAVYTLMSHYVTMLRRYIVSDSETADLCRQIYARHRKALDLIFEHRPDLQLDLAEKLQTMIGEAAPVHGLELDDCRKNTIRFAVLDWDRFPAMRGSQGWTKSERMLLFVFNNLARELRLTLYAGPGPEAVRAMTVEAAKGNLHAFRSAPKKDGKWIQLYRRTFLRGSADYDECEFDDLCTKIGAEWQKFLADDLPKIDAVVKAMPWDQVADLTDQPAAQV